MSELLGTRVGNIRFVDLLGSGGMGDVFVGHDVRLDRRVAVKSIRIAQRLDEETKARFLREARVLSKLDHPNICRIYDYIDGVDSDFLVLELVDGVTLRRAMCNGIKKHQALRYAEQIAGVLAAAHEANVVHRDLKPENVMITADDQVKVLDFGISRSLDEEVSKTVKIRVGDLRLEEPETADPDSTRVDPDGRHSSEGRASGGSHDAESRIRTKLGSVMGTVTYMSPEQARGEHVGAASDMYAFGLVLQEMLTGKAPLDPGTDYRVLLRQAAFGESKEPENVGKDEAGLIKRLKSLAPASRPTAVEALSRLRWIRDRPRRRMRRLGIAAAVTVLMVAAGAYVFDITRQRNVALEARAAEERARVEAEEVVDFLTGLFEVSDPSEARGSTVTARELLDRSSERIATGLEGQPETRARLMGTMGVVYRKLGLYEQATALLEGALTIQEKILESSDVRLAAGLNSLASLYQEQGRYDEAEERYERALAIVEAADGDESLQVAWCLNNLAIVYQRQRRLEEAEPLLKRAVRIKAHLLGEEDPEVARSLNNLGNLHKRMGRYDEAEVCYKRALLIREKTLPDDHPDLARVVSNLAFIYGEQGRDAEAEEHYLRSLEIVEKVYEPDHPEVARTLNNLASFYLENDRYSEAEPMLRRVVPIFEKVRGPQHLEVAIGVYNLGETVRKQGRPAEADALYRRSLVVFETAQGPESPLVAYAALGLANACGDRGLNSEAEALYRRALAIREGALEPGDDDLRETVRDYAAFLRAEGRDDEAVGLEQRLGQ